MSIWRLFVQEIVYRRWNFLLAVLSVVVAVGCLAAELTILRLHDSATRQLLASKERETKDRIAAEETKTKVRLVKFDSDTKLRLQEEKEKTEKRLHQEKAKAKLRLEEEEAKAEERLKKVEDDYRKITKKLGFNILIVSDKEDIPLMDKRNYAKETMPESYVGKLAKAKIITINHLLPMVQEEVDWPGLEGKVLLNGIKGEVPLSHADEKKPLMQPVPIGTVALGHYVHKLLGVKKGDEITFKGKKFKVHELFPYRAKGKEDWTVWMNLEEAQELLNRKGKINAIWALECNCAAEDRLAEVRDEVKKILPNTEVVEVFTDALVRAEARETAKKAVHEALAHEKKKTQAALAHETEKIKAALTDFIASSQAALAQEKEEAKTTVAQEEARAEDELQAAQTTQDQVRAQLTAFAALLIPLVLFGSIVWLVVMTLGNVRERQGEIGILRALGLRSASIYVLFISRAVVVGFVGALLGFGLGTLAGLWWGEPEIALAAEEPLFDPALLLIVLLAAPALCALVGWLAARTAAQQDPAVVLQQA
jgi:ABC-type lipoprotein release transport system permease subunit